MFNLKQVLADDSKPISKRALRTVLLKATSELMLHPKVTMKAIKAWGTMLHHITNK